MQEEIVEFLSRGLTNRSWYLEKYLLSWTESFGFSLAGVFSADPSPAAILGLWLVSSVSLKETLRWTRYRSRSTWS